MKTKTILITGATDGLGRGIAEELARQGHTLLLHGRNRPRLDAVAATLDTTVRTYLADLASLGEVRYLTEQLLRTEDRIDVLIANAGIGGGPHQESVDGHELHFAVNYLSHFLLVTGLLDRLRASAPARIVFVSSLSQEPIDFDDVMLTHRYGSVRAYSQSKLAQIALGLRLAGQLDPAEVTVTSLHPATLMPTKMVVEGGAMPLDSLERGVAATTRLAADPELEGVTGVFYDREHPSSPHPWATDPEVQARLWRLSKQLTQ
ncbi:SDR family NAD(P)-dependent oxidoreductase [Streptomyces sp. NPDC058420]|uniref:SDR family NAD(P)-dependent oxidoreductase n=1 Tax=Streptomyces sp. NPDC058420 TaxID=3346489 RepID=UPI00364D7142